MISWEMDEYGRGGDSTKFQNRKHIGWWSIKYFFPKLTKKHDKKLKLRKKTLKNKSV